MAGQSCQDCPSLLSDSATLRYFGVSFGIGVTSCAQFGHVLGKQGLPEESVVDIYNKFGARCSKFGSAPEPLTKDGTPVTFPRAMVATPDTGVHFRPDGTVRPAVTDEDRAATSSCMSCSHFMPANVVSDELGWSLPMCAAQGRLLVNNRLRVEPQFCPRPTPGSNRVTTDGVELLDFYRDAFTFASIGVKAAAPIFDPTAAYTDPRDYVTDEEVLDIDRESGIRAWRRIYHPRNPEKSVLLPIFDPASFDEAERAKIPQIGDGSGVEMYVDWAGLLYKMAGVIMGMDKTPALIGGAGTGKTEAFQYMAWMCQLPFERIQITRSTEIQNIEGKWILEDGETKWLNGRVSLGWAKRCVMVIDEFNAGPDEVEQFFRPMFDNVKQLVLDGGKGGRVPREPYSFIGLTMNPSWDIKYTGLAELSAAALNRISTVAVDLPDDATERAIIAKFCAGNDIKVTQSEVDKVMAIAHELRQLSDPQHGELPIAWGIRPQLAVVAALPYFELMECYKLACIDALDPISADKVIALVKGYE